MGQLTVYAVATLIAAILAFIAKMPSRVGRIVLLVGSLACAAASVPGAVRESETIAERQKAKPKSAQSPAPTKLESRESNR